MPRFIQIAKDFATESHPSATPPHSVAEAQSDSSLPNNLVKSAKTMDAVMTHSPSLSDGSLTPVSARKIRLKISGSEAASNGIRFPKTEVAHGTAAGTEHGSEAAVWNSEGRTVRSVRSQPDRRRKKLD